MFDVNEKVRCVANDWRADDVIEREYDLSIVPRIGRVYTVQGFIPAGKYRTPGGEIIVVGIPLLKLWEMLSPLEAGGVDGFPARWFRRAIRLDTSAGLATLKSLTVKRREPVEAG